MEKGAIIFKVVRRYVLAKNYSVSLREINSVIGYSNEDILEGIKYGKKRRYYSGDSRKYIYLDHFGKASLNQIQWPADKILNILHYSKFNKIRPTNKYFIKTLKDFRNEIEILIPKKPNIDATMQYIMKVEKGSMGIKEYRVFCKFHTYAALMLLNNIIEIIEKDKTNKKNLIKSYETIVVTLIHHLRVPASFLGSDLMIGYRLFEGFSRNGMPAIEHFRMAKSFFWLSTYSNPKFGIESALLISPFMVRQAVELLLKRAIGLEDIQFSSNQAVKVSLDSLWNFYKVNSISGNIIFPNYKSNVELDNIIKLINQGVHLGYFIYIWQSYFIIHNLSGMFNSISSTPSLGGQFHSNVKIKDLHDLRERFEGYVNSIYNSLNEKTLTFSWNDSPESEYT